MSSKKFEKVGMFMALFKIPLIVVLGILVYIGLLYAGDQKVAANLIIAGVVFVGSIELLKDTVASLLKRQFALDYIALLAITTAVFTGQYLVAAVIVLMLSGGQALEKYGLLAAKRSLTALANRLPSDVFLWNGKNADRQVQIEEVSVGQEIFIRKGEVVPLDGTLESKTALIDESSLTGEPYMFEREYGDTIRSGTVNTGNSIVVRVTREDKDSTYRKILNMVRAAQEEKAPLIRLADRYSSVFTAITLVLAGFSYIVSGDPLRPLAVLVIATPCPLILATPIALMGGVNLAAKRRIIVKRLASLEVLARVRAIIFDKTGTLTLGKPTIVGLDIHTKKMTEKEMYAIAAAIERSSLHPLGKAIVSHAKALGVTLPHATDVREELGVGMRGTVEKTTYTLSKLSTGEGMAIALSAGAKRIGVFHFEDTLKKDTKATVAELLRHGMKLFIFTGDKAAAAARVKEALGGTIEVRPECTPEDKKEGIASLKSQNFTTAMVGDGINDAPALAYADVGMVFSHEEQTAASEAADIVFLGGDFSAVNDSVSISQRTIGIALQSIVFGMGLSTVGMVFASFGFVPPIAGAFFQEAIDILVILNALRAAR